MAVNPSWRPDWMPEGQDGAQAWLAAPVPGWSLAEEVQARRLFEATGHNEAEWLRLEDWQRGAWRREVRDER